MLVFVRRLLSLFLGSVALASFLAALALCCLPPTASADDGRNGPLIVSNCFFDCWCDALAWVRGAGRGVFCRARALGWAGVGSSLAG